MSTPGADTAQLLDLPFGARHRGIILDAAGPAQRLMDWHDSRPRIRAASVQSFLAACPAGNLGLRRRWYAVDDDRLKRELAAEADRQRSALQLILAAGADQVSWHSGAPA
jgi:hypothetical protein